MPPEVLITPEKLKQPVVTQRDHEFFLPSVWAPFCFLCHVVLWRGPHAGPVGGLINLILASTWFFHLAVGAVFFRIARCVEPNFRTNMISPWQLNQRPSGAAISNPSRSKCVPDHHAALRSSAPPFPLEFFALPWSRAGAAASRRHCLGYREPKEKKGNAVPDD